ncbi:hypothetical protein Ocin01_18629 [Orchesella cincta]|uniref:Uncharacterized protein n=1 Tax=Orchesella cincta TaxID=48709 RepID=A0A1D2M562_ORCCI|nr:hypothetical protein Ocin01_18629 [Orchesella cincta]
MNGSKIKGYYSLMFPNIILTVRYFFPTYENDDFLTFWMMMMTRSTKLLTVLDVESNVIPEELPPMAKTNRDFDLAGFAMRYHNESDD